MWHYGFISILSKQILQALWIETVGFLSQNYIAPHNNLVNIIVLLEYFPTSISVCMWNKLHASFYLKDIINMSLFQCFERNVVCMGTLMVHWVYFLVIRIMFVLNSIVWSWGESCMNHRWRWRSCEKSEMVWLTQRFNQSSLKSCTSSFCKLDHSVLCNVLGRSRVCGCNAWETSPTLILVPAYSRRNKVETKALPVWTSGNLNLIVIYIFYYY
jgi:hypothetical protein